MNLDEITKVLIEIYNEPLINENPRHIVFWYDSEGELLDVLKYSIEFSTDKTTVTMRDLNIKDKSLTPIIKNYSKFFNNKERYSAFKKLDIYNYTEENIHIAVLSVLCKLSVLDFEEVTKVLLREFLNKDKSI